LARGFLRNANGAFTTFDPPGAALIGTVPTNINPMGTIAGYYYDINFIGHGFLRAANPSVFAEIVAVPRSRVVLRQLITN
jgi:hypothetical protein